MGESIKLYEHKFFLTAGECNPENEMPLPAIVARLIEVATEHANSWNAGYARLIQDDEAWVLSRVTVEMQHYPRINEPYTFVTWIEEYNRHFSQRNFTILDKDGNEIGYARTVWLVINIKTRAIADLSKLSYICGNIYEKDCPIEPQSRLLPVKGEEIGYRIKYVDTDLNRHVNSVRYIELMMNQWGLEHYDKYMIRRFEIAYLKECLYGMDVKVAIDRSNPNDAKVEITHRDEESGSEVSHCRARLMFVERNGKEDGIN